MNSIKETVNSVVNSALKKTIGAAMKSAAKEAIQDVLGHFVGDILEENEFDRYCTWLYWDIAGVTDDALNCVFDREDNGN